jgi:hypothetical protein
MSNIPPEIQTLLSTQQVVLGKPIGTFMKRSWKDASFKDETTPGKLVSLTEDVVARFRG